MPTRPRPVPATSDAAIVTKATLRAADILQLKDKQVARIIGVSPATVSRMRNSRQPLDREQKPFELAVLFIRLYRSLDAIAGGDDAVARGWLANHNTALNGTPLDLIQTVSGLTNAIQYLDARRALI